MPNAVAVCVEALPALRATLTGKPESLRFWAQDFAWLPKPTIVNRIIKIKFLYLHQEAIMVNL